MVIFDSFMYKQKTTKTSKINRKRETIEKGRNNKYNKRKEERVKLRINTTKKQRGANMFNLS